MENMEGGANAYPVDYPFCPATPPTPDSDDSWPDFEEGVYTDDEDTAPPVTCGCCREERRWLENLQSRCGSIQAECLELATLIAAKQESRKQETRRLMKQQKKAAETTREELELSYEFMERSLLEWNSKLEDELTEGMEMSGPSRARTPITCHPRRSSWQRSSKVNGGQS